jgi:hypothetical protein
MEFFFLTFFALIFFFSLLSFSLSTPAIVAIQRLLQPLDEYLNER